MKRMFIILPLLLLTMAGCKKDDVAPQPTTSDMLVNGVWKMVQEGVDLNDNQKVDPGETAAPDACDADDTYDYQAGGVLVINFSAVKCESDEPDNATLTWSLSNNDTVLSWGAPGSSFTFNFKVISVSENSFTLGMEDGSDLYFAVFGR